MKCRKCGYDRQPRDSEFVPPTECPSCGVLYVKAGAGRGNPDMPLYGKASPLDESSLRQVRQRVEMRLRQKSKSRQRDERQALTLQRARQIAAAAAQLRRAQMIERQLRGADAGVPPAAPEPTTFPPQRSSPGAGPATGLAASAIPRAAPEVRAPSRSANRRQAMRAKRGSAACSFDLPVQRTRCGRMGLLTLVAWLILVAGGVGMILSWTTLTPVEAGVHRPFLNGVDALPLALLLGFAYLATGVLGFAFFWVSSLISLQLKDIRRLLLLQLPPCRSSGQVHNPPHGPAPGTARQRE